MMEVVTLKCRCGNSRVHAGPKVDIAEFLRCALGDGWRRIDEDPVRAIESDGQTEIDLYGICGNCEGREDNFRRSLIFEEQPRRFFSSLRDRIAAAARRGTR